MAVETVAGIADLVITDPTGSEAVSEGDNHLRVIKEAITESFPGFTNGDQVVNGLASQIDTIHEAKTISAVKTHSANLVTSGTAQIQVQDGLVGTPSIVFASDTDTGFYLISAGVIGIAIGGVSIGRIDSSGLRIVGTIDATGDITAFAP